jgi:hypothetical protein
MAPLSAANAFTVTITGTSVVNPAASASVAFSVNLSPVLVSNILPDAAINQPYSQMIQATLGTKPYSWTLNSFPGYNLPPGMQLAKDGTVSGTPTEAGTFMFNVQMIDAGGGYFLATITLQVAPSAGMAVLNGQYAFLVSGGTAESPGANAVVGSFTATSLGAITGGYLTSIGALTNSVNITGGNYAVGTDGRGSMQILTSSEFGLSFDFVIGGSSGSAATSGNFVANMNSDLPMSGTFYAQDSSAFNIAAVSGAYVFQLGGSTQFGNILPFGAAGVFVADGSGNITSGSEDNDTGGTLGTNLALTGFYGAPDSNGHGTLGLVYGGSGQDYAYYIVNSAHLLLVEEFPHATPPPASGMALQQTGVNFTNASLKGTGVFYSAASDLALKTTDAQAGLLTFDGNSNFTLTGSENNGGAISSTSDSGTYSVSASGRATLSGTTHQWVVYLQDVNRADFVGTDADATTGGFVPQQAGPYSNGSFSGTYAVGTHGGLLENNIAQTGILLPDGAGNVSGTLDVNAGQIVTSGVTFTSTYSADSTGAGALAASSVTDGLAFYMDSPDHAYAISANPSNVSSLVQEWSMVTSTPRARESSAPSQKR